MDRAIVVEDLATGYDDAPGTTRTVFVPKGWPGRRPGRVIDDDDIRAAVAKLVSIPVKPTDPRVAEQISLMRDDLPEGVSADTVFRQRARRQLREFLP